MAVKVSGDFARKLDRWSELLEDAQVIVKHTSRAQAEVALTLIGEGFDDESDPYGRKWAKKKRPDGRKVLHGETTRLRNGWHVKADMGGWSVSSSVDYAGYHQAPRGGSRPQRMMVPSGARGLPKDWADELKAVAIAEALAHFKEAANDTAPRTKKRKVAAASGGGGSSASSKTSRRSKSSSSGKLRSLRRLRSK